MTIWKQLVYITIVVLLLIGLCPMGIGIFGSPATVIADPGLNATASEGKLASAAVDKTGIADKFISMPMLFIANQGQADSAVGYYTQMPGGAIYLTKDNIVFDFIQSNEAASPVGAADIESMAKTLNANNNQRISFSLDFIGSSGAAEITSQEKAETVINYYIGNDPQKWLTQIPTYREVLYKNIYPNIDLRLYGKGGAITYDFIVHPGGNVDDIKLAFNGIDGLSISDRELTITTALGNMKQEQLKIYQGEGLSQCEIGGDFRLLSDNSYGFAIAQYNGNRDLVIDPCLMYATYLGGGRNDVGWGIAADTDGNAYVTGCTASTDFPLKGSYQRPFGGGLDGFVAKIYTSGAGESTLVYATYFGGNSDDLALGLALHPNGQLSITGCTSSIDFPITPDAFNPSYLGGETDCFSCIFNSATGQLGFCTYFGGSGKDIAQDITIGADNCTYLTGSTSSTDFRLLNPFQSSSHGLSEAFVIKYSQVSGVVYTTYLGGSGVDTGVAVDADASGCSYIVGITSSADFPTQKPLQAHIAGNIDLFVTKLSADGQSLVYSTYLGGSGYDGFKGVYYGVYGGIAVDNTGCAYITGTTSSIDFPHTASAYQSGKQAGFDAFMTKLSADGQSLAYSTYLGGSSDDFGNDIAVDRATGIAYVAGETNSLDFPMRYPIMKLDPGAFTFTVRDCFISRFDPGQPGAASLAESTYFGGENLDAAIAIALDSLSRVYITGYTSSWTLCQRADHPGFRSSQNRPADVLVARIDEWAMGNHPPYIPECRSPANNATGVSTGPTLAWTGGDPDGDSVTYQIFLSGAGGFPCPGCDNTLVVGPSDNFTFPPGSLQPDKRYVWRVITTDQHGSVSYGPYWTFFTTSVPPSGVTLDFNPATDLQKVVNGDNVTYNVTLRGRVDSLGSFSRANCRFLFNTISNGEVVISFTDNFTAGAGQFSQLVTGLAPGYTYDYDASIAPPGKDWIDGVLGELKNFIIEIPAVNGTGALEAKAMMGTVTRIFTVDPATMPDLNKPAVTFPYGMLSYDIQEIPVGSTVKIVFTFSSALPTNTQYWKCDNVSGWQNITSLLSHNDGDNILELNITDGGLGDADGVANGIITDPGGPAIPITEPILPVTPPPPAPIPTPTSIPAPAPNPLIGTGAPTSHGSSVAGTTTTTQPMLLPNIQIQNASLSATKVAPGMPVTITANIANRGTVNGTTRIKVYVNGEEDSSQGITVESGGNRPVYFTVSRNEPGTYTVYIGGTRAGNFMVEDTINPNIILYISLAMIALAFISGLILIARRKGEIYL